MAGRGERVDAAIRAAGAGKGGTFRLDVSKWVRKAKGNTFAVVRKIILDLGSRVIMRTPVDTGRARGNWMFAIGQPSIATTTILDGGTPPNASGLGSSVSKQELEAGMLRYDPRSGQPVFLTNSLPYITRLEYGWSLQAPRGMVRLTVAEFAGIALEAVKFVQTKGSGGNIL